ncbi:hypothetical protein CBE37_00910 [bacterium TMED277]|nr:MAG: hypothetical protein CBE37_00910 [bacterium TMED277]
MLIDKNTKVLILKGGISDESKVSEATARSCSNALRERELKVLEIAVEVENLPNLASEIRTLKPDVIFNALHGGIGENGVIQGLLETLRVPYTHSGVSASSIAMNKSISKKIFLSQNLPVIKGIFIKNANLSQEIPIQPPFVIKPNDGGSSVGVSFINNMDELDAIAGRLEKGTDYLLEKYVPGRELSVSVLDNKPLTVTDIITDKWYSYEAKYSPGGSIHRLPANIPKNIFEHCMDCAVKAHTSLGCRGISRTDFRWDEEKGIKGLCILEINTQPGMTETSLVPEQAKYRGIEFPELCLNLLKDASYNK